MSAATVTVVTASILLLRHGYLAPLQQHNLTPANATLGFGTILIISRPHSHRLPGLLWAANLTDLLIEVPSQPDWIKDSLHSLRIDSGSSMSEGSALAWLGHLHALRTFLSSDVSTALILEDDADFDLSIRIQQVPMLAPNFHKLLEIATSYWPDLSTWELPWALQRCPAVSIKSLSTTPPTHTVHRPHNTVTGHLASRQVITPCVPSASP